MAVLEANRVADSGGATLTVPPGTLIFHCANSAPSGFLKANGASLSTTTYAALFTAIGYTFGGSGGSFRVPDLRGEFPRGWDDARGVDGGRSFGGFQDGFMNDHTHTGGNHQHTGPSHIHVMPFGWDSGNYYAWLDAGGNPIYGSTVVGGTNRFTFGTSGFATAAAVRIAYTDSNGTALTGTGGAVTTSGSSVTTSSSVRPRNIALLACIKF